MNESITAIADANGQRRAGIAFTELREGRCKFPLGAMTEPISRFCGVPAQIGSPYCPDCRRIAYRRPERR